MDKFVLVLGEESPILPGHLWTQYDVDVLEDKMVCMNCKDNSIVVEIPYSSFVSAELGIGSGNLWMMCQLKDGYINFCSPRKSWKSEAGKKLIEKINSVVEIKDIKYYDKYTGKLFFLYLFK